MFIVLFDIYTHLYLFADKLDFGICRNPTTLQYTRILQYVEQPLLKGRSVVVVQDEIKCITRRTNNDTMDDCALRRQNMFQDTRGTIRSRKSKDRKYNCQNKNRQKDKHRSTKHHTGNKRLSDANLTEKKESYSWKCCSWVDDKICHNWLYFHFIGI